MKKKVVSQLLAYFGLVSISASSVFCLSALTFKINYLDGITKQDRLAASKYCTYNSTPKKTTWTMGGLGENYQLKSVIDQDQVTRFHTPWNKNKDLFDTEEKRFDQICQIIDGHDHDCLDKSFNQSIYNGVVNFIKERNVDSASLDPSSGEYDKNKMNAMVYKPTEDNTNGYLNSYSAALSAGKHILALSGYNHISSLNEIRSKINISENERWVEFKDSLDDLYSLTASNSPCKYEEEAMILLDGTLQVPCNDKETIGYQNLSTVMFRVDQAAFLTALATCMYFMNNANEYAGHGSNPSVGIVGGVNIPTVSIYMGGFQRGVEFFNKFVLDKIINDSEWKKKLSEFGFKIDDAKELKEKLLVKLISLGSIDSHFSGSFVIGDARNLAGTFLNRGADALIVVAGPQTNDATTQVKLRNSSTIVIGVDTALEAGDFQKDSKYHDNGLVWFPKSIDQKNLRSSPQSDKVIKFSAIKKMDMATQQIAKLYVDGKNWEGNDADDFSEKICGCGFSNVGSYKNHTIGISKDGIAYIAQAMCLLGIEQASSYLKFDLTLQEEETFNKTFLPSLFEQKYDFREIDADDTKESKSVSDWLDDNMYFVV